MPDIKAEFRSHEYIEQLFTGFMFYYVPGAWPYDGDKMVSKTVVIPAWNSLPSMRDRNVITHTIIN